MTNWAKYFGTPEKAASFISEIAMRGCLMPKVKYGTCRACMAATVGLKCEEIILEWLQEEADD